jgi:ERCC4-type nuclease
LQFRGEAADVSFSKGANVTREKQWENMLTAVKGVSKRRAVDIRAQYPSAKHIVQAFGKGKGLNVKGVGKKTEEAIKDVFCGV